MAKTRKQIENSVGSASVEHSAEEAAVIEKKTLETGKNGHAFLEGAQREVVVIKPLRDEILKNKNKLVPAFMDLKEKLSQSNKLIRELAEKHKDLLEYDEETETYIYDDGDVHCEINVKTEVSFSVVKADG